MAIDTETKRRSAQVYGPPAGGPFPVPDGTIAAADRAHSAGLYSGLTYSAPTEVPTFWSTIRWVFHNLVVGPLIDLFKGKYNSEIDY